MARLTFPTRPEAQSLADRQPGPNVLPDGVATVERTDEHDLFVTLTDEGTVLTLTYDAEPMPHWVLFGTTDQPSPGTGVSLPEPILARANRLLSADGIGLQRDWRTKTHVLRVAPRRTLPLQYGAPVTAALTSNGWQALAVAGVAEAGSLWTAPPAAPTTPAPSAPAPLPTTVAADPAEHPEGSMAEPTRAEAEAEPAQQPAAMPVQSIPAAYAGKMVLTKQVHAKWQGARAVHDSGEPSVIAFVGPSGAGKTHAVHSLASAEGLDVVKFDCSGVVEPGDWFGTVTLDSGGTRFVPSDLLLAITLPGQRVLLLDEVNRANLRALNAMLPLLDGSGTITIPQSGKRERVNRAVQIVVTANIGSSFLGTEPLDEAIRTRVSTWIEVEHLSEDDERRLLQDRVEGLSDFHAEGLARLGAAIRASSEAGQHPPVSTRQLLSAARMIAKGTDPRMAVDAAVLDGYLSEGGPSSERAKVRPHVTGIEWKEPEPVAEQDEPEQPEGVAGGVYTAAEPDAACTCSHLPAAHGIATDISVSTHCRRCVRDYPYDKSRQCMAYSPRMTAISN